jgi:uncharacterized protein
VQVLTILLAAVVGGLLGLLGGGGSVLAVPLLVFIAGLNPHEAAATSLFVVALTSLVALVPHARERRVRWRAGTFFGLSGMVGAFFGGTVAGHVPGSVLLGVFAVLMLTTALAMIRGRRVTSAEDRHPTGALLRIIALGLIVGALTGFVGAGGGFVVVPALVLLSGLPMAEAVGTSLLVVAMQAVSGMAGYLVGTPIDWKFAIGVATSSVIGAIVGSRITGRIDQEQLRRVFGWFVLMMGLLLVIGQLPGSFAAWGSLIVLIGSVLIASGLVILRFRRRGPVPPPNSTVPPAASVPARGPTGASAARAPLR